jgi:hypothetical protein
MNGKRRGIQTYKCVHCGHKFQNKRKKSRLQKRLVRQYIWQRQTYFDLSNKYRHSNKWVQRQIDQVVIKPIVKIEPNIDLVLVADTTFFSRSEGLTVFREPNLKKIVWWKQTIGEKAKIYKAGKEHLEKNGFHISAVVLDGRTGIREVFKDIPVQMCHFHQKRIIIRYLTTRPKLLASQELLIITKNIPCGNENELSANLDSWFQKWQTFLKQKTTNPETGRWYYTHKRIRSAYRSFVTNLPYLYTYQKYPELKIPNTTNSLDGYFNRLKSLLNVHHGLNPKRRYRIILEILTSYH